MPVWWTKRSLPLSSGVMKPKPLSSLNHLTVPVAMAILLRRELRTRDACTATTAGAEHCSGPDTVSGVDGATVAADDRDGQPCDAMVRARSARSPTRGSLLGSRAPRRGSGWPEPPEPFDR